MEVRDDSWNCATYGRFYKQNLSSVLGTKDLVLLCMEYFASPGSRARQDVFVYMERRHSTMVVDGSDYDVALGSMLSPYRQALAFCEGALKTQTIVLAAY